MASGGRLGSRFSCGFSCGFGGRRRIPRLAESVGKGEVEFVGDGGVQLRVNLLRVVHGCYVLRALLYVKAASKRGWDL